jgi:hypothetical protein
MRLHIAPRRAGYPTTLLTVLFAAGARAALPPPSAPATTDGNYTVSYQQCGGYYYCLAAWLEERVEPDGQFAYTSGSYIDKPSGTYSYRSGVLFCDPWMIDCATEYSPIVSVVVAAADVPPPDRLEDQFLYQFRVKAGNVVGNSGTDILIERVDGGSPGNGVVDAVILEQLSQGVFSAVTPSAGQAGSPAWIAAPIEVALADINVDGYVDLVVKGIDSVVTGADNQILFSPGRSGAGAITVRALDATLRQFLANVLDYIVDNAYFATYAPLTYYYAYVPQFTCPYQAVYGIDETDLEWYLDCLEQYVLVYGVVPDYSVFESRAVSIWSTEAALDAGDTTRDAALQKIADAIEGVLGVAIGGWVFEDTYGSDISIPDADDRRGLELFLAILGIGKAGAQDIDTDQAPEQVSLNDDVIYLLGRYVFGRGIDRMHTSLYYRIPFVGAGTWLSAFDSDLRTMFDGTLVGRTSDPRDAPELMQLVLGTAESDFAQPAYTYFFTGLVPAHEHYRTLPDSLRAPYDAIPELPPCSSCPGRNSNGYINGLLRATNGHPVISHRSIYYDLDRLTGWEYPVEAYYFGR